MGMWGMTMGLPETAGVFLLRIIILMVVPIVAVLLFLIFSRAVGRLPDAGKKEELKNRSGNFAGGRFRNENRIRTLTGGKRYSSNRKRPQRRLEADAPAFMAEPRKEDLTFTWLGHSSVFLQMGGKNVLIDPVLGKRSSPVGFIGPERFSQIPLKAGEIPETDIVFISHDHYDHLDYETIMAIQDRVGVFVMPLGLDSVFMSWNIPSEKIRTLDWWESTEVKGLKLTLTPSQHFSGRNPLKSNSTLWGGLYISDGLHNVYYTGDGGYYGVFAAVRERLGAPDLMFAECGQYDPTWADVHMFPEQTVQAGIDAGTSWLVPVHWGSFCICNHAWDDSIRRVTASAEEAGLPLATPRIGQTVCCENIGDAADKWWEGLR